jgi:hypothetical protein
VEDALDVCHVNRLHYKWLDLALARNFAFAPEARGGDELDLGQALKSAGSLARTKWMNAKSYEVRAASTQATPASPASSAA